MVIYVFFSYPNGRKYLFIPVFKLNQKIRQVIVFLLPSLFLLHLLFTYISIQRIYQFPNICDILTNHFSRVTLLLPLAAVTRTTKAMLAAIRRFNTVAEQTARLTRFSLQAPKSVSSFPLTSSF
jgi:hypothetical protein